jgi:hypothetical protein
VRAVFVPAGEVGNWPDLAYRDNGRPIVDMMLLVALGWMRGREQGRGTVTNQISPTGYKATYRQKNGRVVGRMVQSWGPSGEPQVVHNKRLRDAGSIEGFVGLQSCSQQAGVVPGQGWVQEWCLTQERDAPQAVWPIPVIAWIVDTSGEAQPVIPEELWPEKDCKGQEIDWDTGMSSVRTVLMSTVPRMGWRRYNGSNVESEPWAAQ